MLCIERMSIMGVNIEKVFGDNVFDDAVMKVRLPKSDYEKVGLRINFIICFVYFIVLKIHVFHLFAFRNIRM